MSRIIVQSFCWNCAQFIAAPLIAVHKYVDEIQCFDGAYEHMRKYTKTPHSTDGTDKVVKGLNLECPVLWIPCKDFYKNEVDKKTFMQTQKFWKLGEWKYILSDDEIPIGDVAQAFKRVREDNKTLVGYVPMLEVHPSKNTLKNLGFKPRFLKWQPGLHWRGKHYDLYNAKKRHRDTWPKIVLEEMRLIHLKHLRFKERLNMQLAYERLGY